MQKKAYIQLFNNESDHWWTLSLHALITGIIKDVFNKKINILDAGCGSGLLINKLSMFGHNCTGLDISRYTLTSENYNSKINFIQADLNNFEIKKNEFDCILCLDVLQHKWINNINIIVRNFFDGLKPGGLFICNLPAFNHLNRHQDEIMMSRRRFNWQDANRIIRKSGLKPRYISYRVLCAYFPILIKSAIDKFTKTEKTDISNIPNYNSVLLKIMELENHMIINNYKIPFGSSIFFIGEKRAI